MKKQVELSGRMQAVADFVTEGNRVCDVGCDHGYVSIYLIQAKVSPKVLAMDVNKGPLLRAEEHVKQYGLTDYITLRLSDGLTEYECGEADTLLCAGMGGRLLQKILAKEPHKTADFQELILQPQSEIANFRKFLRKEGYLIVAENMILEDGKFYPIMKVKPSKNGDGKENTEEIDEEKQLLEDTFGPFLLKEKNPILLRYIKQELLMKKEILSGLQKQQKTEKVSMRQKEMEGEILLLHKAEEQF